MAMTSKFTSAAAFGLLGLLGLAGCGGQIDASQTTDMTPPTANLEVDASGQQTLIGPTLPAGSPKHSVAGVYPLNTDFNVTLGAQDAEFGISHLKITFRKVVCFITSQGVLSGNQAYFTGTLKSADYSDPHQLPASSGLADSLNTRTLLSFKNANGQTITGVGLVMEFSGSSTNGAGLASNSTSIVLSSGQSNCGGLP